MGRKGGEEKKNVYSMAESDYWEPYRAHDQVYIAITNAVDKTAATKPPGDTQHTGGTHLETGIFYFKSR